jgi:hypothetical protein
MEERRRKETRKEKTKKKLPQAWDRLPHAGCTLAAADGHEVETEAAGGGGGGGGGGKNVLTSSMVFSTRRCGSSRVGTNSSRRERVTILSSRMTTRQIPIEGSHKSRM